MANKMSSDLSKLLPLLSNQRRLKTIKPIIPSRWFIIGFAIAIISSRIAHFLDDIGVAHSGLVSNLSKFRETSNYYFFVLYG